MPVCSILFCTLFLGDCHLVSAFLLPEPEFLQLPHCFIPSIHPALSLLSEFCTAFFFRSTLSCLTRNGTTSQDQREQIWSNFLRFILLSYPLIIASHCQVSLLKLEANLPFCNFSTKNLFYLVSSFHFCIRKFCHLNSQNGLPLPGKSFFIYSN